MNTRLEFEADSVWLLERRAELEQLDRLLARTDEGDGGVAVIQGPAGVGKTALLGSLVETAAARGFLVLRARGSELELSIPFGVARQLFEPSLRAAEQAERRRLLDGAAALGARAIGIGHADSVPDQVAASHGLYWLCMNLADVTPVVIAVDDVQWVDDSSLAFLGYLGRRASELQVMVVLALREGWPGGPRPGVDAVVGGKGVQRIGLSTLGSESSAALVRAEFGEQADACFCATCHELTGGNPLYLRELLAAAADGALNRGRGQCWQASFDRNGGDRQLSAGAAGADGRGGDGARSGACRAGERD